MIEADFFSRNGGRNRISPPSLSCEQGHLESKMVVVPAWREVSVGRATGPDSSSR